jgi:hypothetical protein
LSWAGQAGLAPADPHERDVFMAARRAAVEHLFPATAIGATPSDR